MDEVREEFERFVDELRTMKGPAALTGADGERGLESTEQLIGEYRARLQAEESPVRGRELLERFREEVRRM